MPTLMELGGQFIRFREESSDEMLARGVAKPTFFLERVSALNEAHGIRFICPKSFAAHGGMAGAHSVQVYFAGSPVPNHIGVNKNGDAVRWNVSGTSLDDLSLSPSIQEQDSICGWHGFVGSSGVPPGSAS